MAGLFGETFEINGTKQQPKKAASKKTAKVVLNDSIKITDNNLYGDEFIIKSKEQTTDVEKLLKSKKLSLAERLAIINENVLNILGKQKKNILVIKTKEQLHDYISDCIKTGRIDIDTETNNSLDPVTCKLMGPCFYAPGLKQVYVPINHRDPETKERLSWQLTEQDVKEELQRLVDAKTMIIMHNGKFDYEVICCTCDIRIKPDWDTMIAARLLNENEHASLKELYIKYIDPSQAKYKIDKLFDGVQYADVDPDIFALYAATDAMMTDRIYEIQVPKMEEADKEARDRLVYDRTAPKGLYWVFKNIEMPIVVVTAEMEMRGVAVDTEFGAKLKAKYDNELKDIDNKINLILDNLKDTIMKWKLSPEANEKVKIYPAKKTKMSTEKIEKTFDRVDEEGKRFKYGKAKIELLEDPINLASPAQLAVLFYDILKCEAVNKDKVRGAGKDELEKLGEQLSVYAQEKQNELNMSEEEIDEAFEAWLNSDAAEETEDIEINESAEDLLVHRKAADLCDLLLKRRGLVKLISTYIDVIPELTKHWSDGRIRSHYNSMGTDTGRYSSGGKLKFMENEQEVEVSGINWQNIPSHSKDIRLMFKADTKYDKTYITDNYYQILEYQEVETVDGWKRIVELVPGDKLVNSEGSYDIITNIIKKDNTYLLYV